MDLLVACLAKNACEDASTYLPRTPWAHELYREAAGWTAPLRHCRRSGISLGVVRDLCWGIGGRTKGHHPVSSRQCTSVVGRAHLHTGQRSHQGTSERTTGVKSYFSGCGPGEGHDSRKWKRASLRDDAESWAAWHRHSSWTQRHRSGPRGQHALSCFQVAVAYSLVLQMVSWTAYQHLRDHCGAGWIQAPIARWWCNQDQVPQCGG